MQARKQTHHEESDAKIIPRKKGLEFLRDDIRLFMSPQPCAKRARRRRPQGSLKPLIVRADDDEPNHRESHATEGVAVLAPKNPWAIEFLM